MTDAAAWAIGLGGLGAIVGSFLAALAIRWPEGRSVLWGRSACDSCGRALGPGELVPLVSFAVQRGRCRGCGASIDRRHVAVEVAAVLVGVSAGWLAPGVAGAAGAVFGWLLLVLAVLDLTHWWLPDRLTGMLAVLGLAAGLAGLEPSLIDRVIGGLAGFGGLAAIAWAYRAVRGREGMGGGDPKLLGAIGCWVGWRMLPGVLLLASLIGLGVVLLAAASGRAMERHSAVPFGAMLAAAAYPAWGMMLWLAP